MLNEHQEMPGIEINEPPPEMDILSCFLDFIIVGVYVYVCMITSVVLLFLLFVCVNAYDLEILSTQSYTQCI